MWDIIALSHRNVTALWLTTVVVTVEVVGREVSGLMDEYCGYL